MIKRFDRVYIVLDALDESESDRGSQEIQDRQHKRNLRNMLLRWITEVPGSGASILVTSREESDIKSALGGGTVWRIPIQTREVDNDVKLHVERYVQNSPKLNKLPTGIIAEIKDKLVSGSQGM
jgi:NACHT domain